MACEDNNCGDKPVVSPAPVNHEVRGLLDYYYRAYHGFRQRAHINLVQKGVSGDEAASMLTDIESGLRPHEVERAFRDG